MFGKKKLKIKNKKPVDIITNRFFLVTLFFLLWMIFFDTYSYFSHRDIDQEIKKLEENKVYYSTEIDQDMKQIKKLNKMEEVEKYAREKYFMKRDNEDIYIIDAPVDSLEYKEIRE